MHIYIFCHNPSLYHVHGDGNFLEISTSTLYLSSMILDLADDYPGKSLKTGTV